MNFKKLKMLSGCFSIPIAMVAIVLIGFAVLNASAKRAYADCPNCGVHQVSYSSDYSGGSHGGTGTYESGARKWHLFHRRSESCGGGSNGGTGGSNGGRYSGGSHGGTYSGGSNGGYGYSGCRSAGMYPSNGNVNCPCGCGGTCGGNCGDGNCTCARGNAASTCNCVCPSCGKQFQCVCSQPSNEVTSGKLSSDTDKDRDKDRDVGSSRDKAPPKETSSPPDDRK